MSFRIKIKIWTRTQKQLFERIHCRVRPTADVCFRFEPEFQRLFMCSRRRSPLIHYNIIIAEHDVIQPTFSSDIINVAEAPSVRNEEFAAVCVPCGLIKAGFSLLALYLLDRK